MENYAQMFLSADADETLDLDYDEVFSLSFLKC